MYFDDFDYSIREDADKYEGDDFDYDEREYYEDDLLELSNREAFEDVVAERVGMFPESDEYDFSENPVEDSYLDTAYEDRTEIEHMGYGEY